MAGIGLNYDKGLALNLQPCMVKSFIHRQIMTHMTCLNNMGQPLI